MIRALNVIPARKGSKGLPGKNTKLLGKKPLIVHTIEFAKKIKQRNDIICISTNDDKVIHIAKNFKNISIIIRPEELATDTIGMNDVLLHVIESFEEKKIKFDRVLLLQPTSPLRIIEDYKNICKTFDMGADLAVSVKLSKANPYFNLFEEDISGYLKKCKKQAFATRQLCPKIYEYNGSMYLADLIALKKYGLHGMKKIRNMVMPEERSVDIDNMKDWVLAAFYYKKFK